MISKRIMILGALIVLFFSVARADGPKVGAVNLQDAFEQESIAQLGLSDELKPPSDLELLKRENESLKQRVLKLEQRLAVVEKTLAVSE